MTQITPPFGASGASGSEGSVPSPGSVAGTSRYLREDAAWAVPNAGPPGPVPPSPGPALDQWACNAAGFILYECCYKLTKAAIDTNFFSLALDAIIGFAFDSLAEVLLPLEILDAGFLSWLENWVATSVQANLATFLAHIEDQALWSKFHCFLYNEIRTAGNASNTTLLAAGTALAASGISPASVTNGVALILEQLGIMTVGPIPLSAFIQNYDCSTCAGTGADSAPIPIQPGFDLLVGDGSTSQGFINDIEIPGASIAYSGGKATLSITAGVSSVTATSPLASSGGATPDISLASPVPTNLGGLGVDTSGFTKGTILGASGSGWVGDGPASDGLFLMSRSSTPSGTEWVTRPAVAPLWYVTSIPPTASNWTQVNTSGLIVADGPGGPSIDGAVAGGTLALMVRPVSVPYDIVLGLVAFMPVSPSGGQPQACFAIRDSSSGKIVAWRFIINGGTPTLAVSTFSSATVGVANPYLTTGYAGAFYWCAPPLWLRVRNNGTNRVYSIGRDGVNWLDLYAESSGTYITEDQAGFALGAGAFSVAVGLTCISWNGP